MVGRTAERNAVLEVLRRSVADSRPQLLTVLGSAGIGKSRLLLELLEELPKAVPETRMLVNTVRPGGTVRDALARILRTRLGIAESADAFTQAQQLRARITELFGDRRVHEMLYFLGAFLGLRFSGSELAETIEENSRAWRQVARAVLRRFFEVDARRSPLVLCLEDVHLAPPEELASLREMVEATAGVPLLWIVTARPELLARFRDWPEVHPGRHHRIDLSPLNDRDSSALVRSALAPARGLPEELVEAAVEMAGGNPMLLERIARIFVEQRVVVTEPSGAATVDLDKLDSLQLPMSVEDVVQSRLSALTPAERDLLERAAIMGPVFWLGGLVVLGRAGREAPELWGGGEDVALHYRDLLFELEARDYVLRIPDSSLGDDEEWIFKHNLERETLEALVAPATAREWHLMLAEWLELRAGERAEEQLDLLAWHYERGDRPLRAARCFLASADKARSRYAHEKAASQYARGLELLGEYDIGLRLEAHHHLGDVLGVLGRIEESHAHFRYMLSLSWRLNLRGKGGAAHNRMGRLFRDAGQLDLAMRHLGTGLALFQAAQDERGIASSLDDIGKVHWLRGNYESALRFLQDALTRREGLGDSRSLALSLNNVGLVMQDSGRFAEAQSHLERALTLRREVEDLQGVTATLNNLGTLYQDRGEHAQALELWREGLEVAREVGDRRRQAVLLLNIGEAHYRMQNPDEALRILAQAEPLCVDSGDRILMAESARAVGKAHLLRGDRSTAQVYLEQALAQFDHARSKAHAAVARRSLAECLADGGLSEERGQRAESLFREALHTFEELGNELEHARTARSLAELLGRHEAHAQEAAALRARAEEVFARLSPSAGDPDRTGRLVAAHLQPTLP